MTINNEIEEQIINFGVFGYNAQKISNILNISIEVINKELSDEKSDFYRLYQKGKDIADYVIDLKLFEMAKSGDIKALDKLEFRKRNR